MSERSSFTTSLIISFIFFASRRFPFNFSLMYVVEIGFFAIEISMSSPYLSILSLSQVSSYNPISVSLSSLLSVISRMARSSGTRLFLMITRSPACRSRKCARFSLRIAIYFLPTRIGIFVALSFMRFI